MTALSGLAQVPIAALPKNRTGPAFQVNAFQNDAFQINAGTSSGTGVLADGAATVSGVGSIPRFKYLRNYVGSTTGITAATNINFANIALNVGEFAVLIFADENASTTDGFSGSIMGGTWPDGGVTKAVKDSVGNTWSAVPFDCVNARNVGQTGGTSLCLVYSNISIAMASSGSNFLTFLISSASGTNPKSLAWTLNIFQPDVGFFGQLETYGPKAGGNACGGDYLVQTAYPAALSSDLGTLTLTTLTDAPLLRVRAITCRGSPGTITQTSGWDGVFATQFAGTQAAAGEYSLGVTTSSLSSHPTFASPPTAPWMNYYAAFRATPFIRGSLIGQNFASTFNAYWGSGFSTTTSQTSVSAGANNSPVNVFIRAGDLAVTFVAQQATANNVDEGIVTSVTDSSGNTWVKAKEWSYNPSSWPNGACVSAWYSNVTTDLTGSSTVTAHFTANSQHNSSIIEVLGFRKQGTISLVATNTGGNTGTQPGSLDCTTVVPYESALRLRAFASAVADSSTPAKTGGAWNSTLQATANSGTNLNLSLHGEWGVSSGTGLASNPPAITSANHSSVYLTFGVLAPLSAAGVLIDGAATVSGSGLSISTGTGVLVDGAAGVSGVGSVLAVFTGAGALVDDAAIVAGVGSDISTGTGALADGAVVVSGVGQSEDTGSGALVDDAASVSGVAVLSWSASGVLVDGASIVVGTGNVAATVWTGTGALVDDASTASGIGFVLSADGGGGALVDDAASVSGIAKISDFAVGALADGGAAVGGSGFVFFAGIGVLADGESVVSGAGAGTSLGAGVLVDALTVLSGIGAIVIPGAGVLVDGISTASGAGLVLSTDDQGSGSLLNSAVVLSDIGQVYWLATGALVDAASIVVGSANIISTGRGIDNDTASFVVGVGFLSLLGSGALIDDAAVINGVGQIFADPPGGILSDSFATVSGSGLSFSIGAGALVDGAVGLAGAGILLVPLVGTGALVSAGSSVTGFGLSETIGAGALVDSLSVAYGLDSVLEISAALADGVATVFGRGASLTVGSGNLHAGSGDVVGYVSRGFNPFYTVTQQVSRGFEVAGAGRGFNVTQQTTRYPFTVTDQRKR